MTPEQLEAAGVWAGLVISLSLFSLFLGQQWHSRLIQHLFLGALMGYLLLLVWEEILEPRLLRPLAQPDSPLGPLLLVGLLAAGALARARSDSGTGKVALWLARLASLAGSFLVTAALATALLGAWQGTIQPQALTAISTAYWLPIALLITSAMILTMTFSPMLQQQWPGPVTSAVTGLIRLGRPLLLLASGMVLARLLASRITLLTAFLDRTWTALGQSGVMDWLSSLWA